MISSILETVLAYATAHTKRNVRMMERHLAELRRLTQPLLALEAVEIEPAGLVTGVLGDNQGYEIATDDDGLTYVRVFESLERDAAVAARPEGIAQLRRDLLRCLVRQMGGRL